MYPYQQNQPGWPQQQNPRPPRNHFYLVLLVIAIGLLPMFLYFCIQIYWALTMR